MLELAVLKGLAQGYMLTTPAMLIMVLVGQEGTLGATQAIGGVFTACLLYIGGAHHGAAPSQDGFCGRADVIFSGRGQQRTCSSTPWA